MQATLPATPRKIGRNIGFFLIPLIVAFAVVALATAVIITNYQNQHQNAIFTGVSVSGIDLSQMTREEATTALSGLYPAIEQELVTLHDSDTGQEWAFSPADLGMTYDLEATVDTAYEIGRRGGPGQQIQELFQSWYYGRSLSPVLIFDEGQIDATLNDITTDINQPATNATLMLDGATAVYEPGQTGKQVDMADLRQRLLPALTQAQPVEAELLIHTIQPAFYDSTAASQRIQQILDNPMYFYLSEPLDDLDLGRVELPREELASWLRVEVVTGDDGAGEHQVFVDENAVRHWLRQFEEPIYRDPVGARFYFDDDTQELVLVSPHINGRQLDLDATIEQFKAQVGTPNHSVPFAITEIEPEVNSEATAVELGITELITETTTWFYGSSDERKHNIARSAANFYGIVIAPGEEFSFNKYLGSISEADGYEEGFVIVGGLTIKGVGGGVCQVSTTIYQAAFLSGFPITERWAHGYMVGYYNDGQGPGMDATVYSPIIDFRFINNTPHHLLIENYYNEEFEALTFKFYSTSMGRTVVKEGPFFDNVTDIPGPDQDRWDYIEDQEPGTVEQVDWATEGADVSVRRYVYNADGDLMEDRWFISNYIPIPSLFHYGPGVEPYDYSLVPED